MKDPPPSVRDQERALEWLSGAVSARLATTVLPIDLSSSRVRNGRLWLRADGLFEVRASRLRL